MSAPVNWSQVEASFDAMFQNNGIPAQVTLHADPGAGTTFSIQVFLRRAQADENLTDGLQQDRDRVSVMRQRWDNAAPRPPQKGDLFVISGRRRRAMEAQPVECAGLSNDTIGYNIRVTG